MNSSSHHGNESLPTLLVVLGAGASFDCANASSTTIEEWRPPLAADLFNISKRPQYEGILQQYHGANVLAADLAEQSLAGTLNLERSLRTYSRHDDDRLRHCFFDVPPYLNALITQVSRRYTKFHGTFVRFIISVLSDVPHYVVFVSLNYDNILEQALAKFDARFRFGELDDYVNYPQAIVIKPHGSIDWGIRLPSQSKRSTYSKRLIPEIPRDGFVPEMKKEMVRVDYYPALTAPLAEKTEHDFMCPISHLTTLTGRLPAVRKALFIGTSGWDHHVLRYLDGRLGTLKHYCVVAQDDAAEIRTRLVNSMSKLGTAQCVLFSHGFREFVGSTVLQDFLRQGA